MTEQEIKERIAVIAESVNTSIMTVMLIKEKLNEQAIRTTQTSERK